MKPRITAWQDEDSGMLVRKIPTEPATTETKKIPTEPATTATKKKKRTSGLDDLLGTLKKSGKSKKKADKPLVILKERAEDLLQLQQMKAQAKTLKGSIDALEGELFPEIEALRLQICQDKDQYVGSIHVQATALEGDVNAGQALYYVQNKYVGFDPTEASSDEELQEEYGGDATLKDEALQAVMNEFGGDEDEAEGLLENRMEVSHSISLEEGALKDPKVVKILQMHLAKHLVSKTVMKPAKNFHEMSSFDEGDKALMATLVKIGLVRRYKAVLKSSGAPKA